MNGSIDQPKHHRRSIRLAGYDYTSEGGYFITVVTHEHSKIFGEIIDGIMHLNNFGRIVRKEWFITAKIRPNVELIDEEFVIMPNHIHGIIWLLGEGRGSLQRTPTVEQYGKPVSNSIPTIIRLFKSTTTKQINVLRQTIGQSVWQRNYNDPSRFTRGRTDRGTSSILKRITKILLIIFMIIH